MLQLWKVAKISGFISADHASAVVGLTKNNNKSTLDIFKPGEPYFYVSPKIHKLSVEELVFLDFFRKHGTYSYLKQYLNKKQNELTMNFHSR